MDHFAAIADQRRALADVLDGLTDEQWATPSLCEGWTVHDVVGHLLVPFDVSMPRVLLEMAKARGNFARANVALAKRAGAAPSRELAARYRANADSRFTPPGYDWHAPLTDTYVHTIDICVPLGIDAPADPTQWPLILDFLVSRKARGAFLGRALPSVRLVATDQEWAAGDGPEVRGPGMALAAVALGRTALGDRLDGPGAAALLAWAAGADDPAAP